MGVLLRRFLDLFEREQSPVTLTDEAVEMVRAYAIKAGMGQDYWVYISARRFDARTNEYELDLKAGPKLPGCKYFSHKGLVIGIPEDSIVLLYGAVVSYGDHDGNAGFIFDSPFVDN